MAFFNKQLLLESQDTPELFKLHLPNPQKLIQNIIDNDNVEMLMQIDTEIILIVESTLSHYEKEKIINFKNTSCLILDNILQMKDNIPLKILLYYLSFSYNETIMTSKIYNFLITNKKFFIKNQIEQITYAIYKQTHNGKYGSYHKNAKDLFISYPKIIISKENMSIYNNIIDIKHNIFRISMKVFLSLDEIDNEISYREYLNWIMEMLKYIPFIVYHRKGLSLDEINSIRVMHYDYFILNNLEKYVNNNRIFYYNLNYSNRNNFVKNIKIINIINSCFTIQRSLFSYL